MFSMLGDMRQVLLILLAIACAAGEQNQARIYGGQNATSGQFPYVVAINNEFQYCNGVIIAPSWILTAAQCLFSFISGAEVLVGTHLNHVNGTAYNINTTIAHEFYNSSTLENDIGLIKIDGVLEYSDTIQPIEFGGPSGVNATCTVAGWGETLDDPYPENLQYVDLTVIDLEYCQNISSEWLFGIYLGREHLCAFGPYGKGACHGDLGAPLICDGKLAGIGSYTVGFYCLFETPDIFINIEMYSHWILANIQD